MNESDTYSNEEIITVENLQDYLIYDDTFLDYFNVFLKLPVFPQPLEYERLTDSFTIIDEGGDSVVSGNSDHPFMASEAEHNKLLEWAQKYRLPMFLETDLYRELKLSKLLIKPLETFSCSSRETYIHGYSKQTNCSSFTTPTPSKYSDLSSKSNSASKSTKSFYSSSHKQDGIHENSDEDFIDNIPYDNYLRPGSRAISLPIQIKLGKEKSLKNYPSAKRSQNEKTVKNMSNLSEEFNSIKSATRKSNQSDFWGDDNIFYRIQSAPLNFDAINFGSINNEIEESVMDELDNIEGRQKISLQKLKEVLIGTHEGMNEFGKFLKNTAGKSLCEFWLDCEQLKDLSSFRTEEENIDLRNNLLRNLKDKYKLSLTKSAKDQLNEAMKNSDKLHSVFLQAQYDSLRRLRSYWLPRFIIHQESIMRQYTITDLFYLRQPTFQSDTTSIQSGVFPKLMLQKALPCTTDQFDFQTMNWHEIMCLSNKSISEPTRTDIVNREKSNFADAIFKRSAFQNRLRFALGFDTASGCPFKNYLLSQNQLQQVKFLEFFEEVLKFKSIFSRNSDRLLRISHAWSIVNNFFLPTGSKYLEIPTSETAELISLIKKYKSSIKCEIFDEILEVSVKKVQQQWLVYLKEDVKRFMESSFTHFDNGSPPHTLDEVEVTIEGEKIVVRRKLDTREIEARESTWSKLSKKEKQLRREKALKLKQVTEEARRQVLKDVKRRIKLEKEEERRLKTMSYMKFHQTSKIEDVEIESGDNQDESMLLTEETEMKIEETVPEIKSVLSKNKTLLTLLKKYISDNAEKLGKNAVNSMMLLHELSNYFSLIGIDKATISAKDSKAVSMYKNYFDKTANRLVPLTEKIRNKLSNDQERPKSPTLKDIQNHMYHSLSDVFSDFWKFQIAQLNVKSDILAKMNERELQILAGNQLSEAAKANEATLNKTAVPTKEDKKDLMLALQDASYQPLSLQILYFFNYLIETGPQDKMNNIEKDLFFYVEILKLQEICRTTIDEDIAKRKIQCISNAFLESVHPPTVQINITNDLAQQIIRRVQRQMTSKEINLSIFDEASYQCLKNLLPFWAKFQQNWEQLKDIKLNIVSKNQRILDRRLKIYNEIPIPKADVVSLPVVPKTTNLTTLSYTMNDGAKWKQPETGLESVNNRPDGTGSDSTKSILQPFGKKLNRKLSRLSVT